MSVRLEIVRPEQLGEGDDPWLAYVPAVWRVVADPDSKHRWVSRPDESGNPYGWFCSAMQLALWGLGWSHVGVGLERWRSLGKPTDSVLLDALDSLWGDSLDEVQAWCNHSDYALDFFRWIASETGTAPSLPKTYGDVAWPMTGLELPSPLVGGGDAFHLAAHSGTPLETYHYTDPADAGRWVRQATHGSAVLIAPTYAGWAHALHTATVLPLRADGRSWRVDVVCQPIGWLGTFRLSRTTGRWFTGRHRDHLLGWPPRDQ